MEYLIEVMPQLLVGKLHNIEIIFIYLDWLITIRDCFSIRIVFAF